MNEMSERALSLTEDVIRMNPANYTAWQFRRQCLYALKKDLDEELDEFVQVISIQCVFLVFIYMSF